jgi:hypothetical protein
MHSRLSQNDEFMEPAEELHEVTDHVHYDSPGGNRTGITYPTGNTCSKDTL